MRTFVTIIQILVRLLFLTLVILGITFWSGHALNLIPLHMALGIGLVLGLWITSIVAASARVAPALVAAGLVWGAVVVAFGAMQAQWLPGTLHWVVQVAHLIIGMAAIALNERLARLSVMGPSKPAK